MIIEENCQDKKDEELVALVLSNWDFFLCLMKRYEAKLFGYARRITNLRDEEIEDLLQDVFIKVYRNLNDFDKELKFSSWIYRITHNEVINNYRKSQARPQAAWEDNEEILNNIASEFSIEKEIDHSFLKDNISSIMAEMDGKYKEVLILKFLEEKDYKEISDILKKPMGTIATLVNRAKKQFAKKLNESRIKLK